MTVIILSFIFFLLMFAVIGMLSVLKADKTTEDYLLAGQNVKPWLVSLSAVATNNSGYMFVGMIGYTYLVGLSSMWILVGWVFGDLMASLYVHKKVRIVSQERQILSFSGLISRWNDTDFKILRMMSGVITILFLGVYAAAQLKAGSKALNVLFGWDYYVGAVIGAIIVLLYCLSGGIRASIWTDAAQSFVMIIAMFLLIFFAVNTVGGVTPFIDTLNQVSPTYLNILPESGFGLSPGIEAMLFIAGWFFAGFGTAGQPHIMVRFMVMQNPNDIVKVRWYYYSWYIAFSIFTILVGLAARILIPQTAMFDAELALPLLSMELLPHILVGLVMAGLFAATMSTADSQILSCCACLTNDFSDGKRPSYLVTKLGTLFVVAIALIVALHGGSNVFELVVVAWAVLASSFSPIIFVYVFGGKPSQKTAVAMIVSSLAMLFYWRHLGLGDLIFEVAPGVLTGIMVYYVSRLVKANPDELE